MEFLPTKWAALTGTKNTIRKQKRGKKLENARFVDLKSLANFAIAAIDSKLKLIIITAMPEKIETAFRILGQQVIAFFPNADSLGFVMTYRKGNRFKLMDGSLIDSLPKARYNQYENLLHELESKGFQPVVLSSSYSFTKTEWI